MFYHVLVETNEKDKNGNNRQYHELDIQDKNKLLEKFVIPYLKEQPLRIDGYKIADVYRFVVTQSDLDIQTVRDKKQEEWNRKQRESSVPFYWSYSKEEGISR